MVHWNKSKYFAYTKGFCSTICILTFLIPSLSPSCPPPVNANRCFPGVVGVVLVSKRSTTNIPNFLRCALAFLSPDPPVRRSIQELSPSSRNSSPSPGLGEGRGEGENRPPSPTGGGMVYLANRYFASLSQSARKADSSLAKTIPYILLRSE
jgi:hypothetical protein